MPSSVEADTTAMSAYRMGHTTGNVCRGRLIRRLLERAGTTRDSAGRLAQPPDDRGRQDRRRPSEAQCSNSYDHADPLSEEYSVTETYPGIAVLRTERMITELSRPPPHSERWAIAGPPSMLAVCLSVRRAVASLMLTKCGERLAFCGMRGLGQRLVLGDRIGEQGAAAAGRAAEPSLFIGFGSAAPGTPADRMAVPSTGPSG